MNPTFDDLTALRDQWQAMQPIAPEAAERLWKKLRLEWNYHSNHIEGNTLTYGETELLLLHDRTHGNHSHRDYLEMKAHDVAIEHIRKMAADPDRGITGADIRDLNRIILKEAFWKPAETPDGQPTRKEIIPGQYKTTPNNVRLRDGSTFFFASPEETAPRMQALVEWLHGELVNPTLHPVALAARIHHDFVIIHPFDDGNGRVARLLVNFVLMRVGYLPIIVRTEDKANYLTALQLADAGDLSPLVAYLGKLAEWSLHTGLKAARGETIDELNDVEKELAIFIRNQQEHQDKLVPRSVAAVREIYDLGLKDFLGMLAVKLGKLSPLFASSEMTVNQRYPQSANPLQSSLEQLLPLIDQKHDYKVSFNFRGYKGKSLDPIALEIPFRILFDEFHYIISVDEQTLANKSYTEPVLADEAERLATGILADAFARIKSQCGPKDGK